MKNYFNRTAEQFRTLEQARISGLDQIKSLRVIFKNLAVFFEKINTDVDDSLSQHDKDAIGEIVKDLYEVMEDCEGTVSQIRALTKKKPVTKSEFDVLREKLNGAFTRIFSLQMTLNTSVSRPLSQAST